MLVFLVFWEAPEVRETLVRLEGLIHRGGYTSSGLFIRNVQSECLQLWNPRRNIDDYVNWAPRAYNTVPDHMANAAMDRESAWEHWHTGMLRAHLAGNGSLKLCVDGGLRRFPGPSSTGLAAMGLALYMVQEHVIAKPTFTLAGLAAQPLENASSAFETKILTLEWALGRISPLLI